MSVTSLLKEPEVNAQLDRILPTEYPRRVTAALVAEPVNPRSAALIGTAFDYALRFELERRYPHARTEAWVADASVRKLLLGAANPMISLDHLAQDVTLYSTAKKIVADAHAGITHYLKDPHPTPEARTEMVAHAIRLGKVDVVFRAGSQYADPNLALADPGDVKDILRLLDVTPYERLTDHTSLWLNPTFGRYSEVVGGADADAIAGNVLIDFKATKDPAIDKKYVRQLVSYVFLARGARHDDPAFPEVRAVGIYFARHAELWTLPVAPIVTHPAYAEVEAWYFEHAGETFGASLDALPPRLLPRAPSTSLSPGVPVKVKGEPEKSASKKVGKKRET